ncbi:hypothetical protein BG006_002671 [Podila minutissima]|uniref:Uncharacterized protein n=1 Tax=Podila minutissima TaxID=64525 RepID=A0A9P5S957_9FUNG|nr:hypothetical protein BG006_002671 [Podila minutissima]
MAIHSVSTSASTSSSSSPSPSPTTTSSPTLSSPSTSTTTPASQCSPSSKSSSHLLGNSIYHDSSSSASEVKSINILNNNSNNNNSHNTVSDPFGFSDYFSSSVPKSSFANSSSNNNSNSIHIGSLSGLSGLSLAAQGLHPLSTPTGTPSGNSTLSSGLFGYNNTSSSNLATSSSSPEEISTIFVVGFPEDMQEREFQNMFVFTPGFEAATLKIPNKDQQEDDALTLGVNGVNPRKQIVSHFFRVH